MSRCFLVIFFLAESALSRGIRPSFSCEKNKTLIESAICQSEELSLYDLILAKAVKEKNSIKGFKQNYLDWFRSLNHCSLQSKNLKRCVLMKYAAMLEKITDSYGGFGLPFVPDFECFRPLMPYLDGDQGFYAVRIVSSGKGCGFLRRPVLPLDDGLDRRSVRFWAALKGGYSYEIEEVYGYRFFRTMILVRFGVRYIVVDGQRQPTIVMFLVEH